MAVLELGTPYSALSRSASFAHCERLARRTGRNFYPAFLVLPRHQRRAMCALYAFMRVTDDTVDDAPPGAARAALAAWRSATEAALAGEPSHPLHPALAATVRDFGVPPRHLFEVIDGVAMDLDPVRYAAFADLHRYCYHVASAVGLACIHVWGFAGERAHADAVNAGVAFQLTNVLRDLGEDLGDGRVYLPADELGRFGCPPERWRDPAHAGAFRELMRFQVARARSYYEAGDALAARLKPAGRAVFRVMCRTYRGVLDEIERRGYDVFTERVRLGPLRKAGIVLGALPTRWGLV